MLPPTLASIPEAKEEYTGSSLIERTARLHTFNDLGPADLCTIRKISSTSKKNTEIGTFLYFTGVDTSNSASIAAHLQGLATLMGSKSQYWFGEKKYWKVPELTYCSYNAFSKVDMRVTVHIPGKFESSVVSSDGKLINDKLSPSELETLWLETFVSSIIRSLLDSDEDDVNKVGGLVEVRKINPLNNGKASKDLLNQFMLGFEKLFYEGPKLGCGVEIPQASLISNYLIDGFLKCVQLTQNYEDALQILSRLEANEGSVVSLIAQVLLLKDEEIKAVQLMSDGIAHNNRDADLLLLQAQFCSDKKRYDLALDLAKQAVKSSPSDFKTWALLVKVYTKLGDFENALLCLNSCPMNSHKEKFSLKRVVPLRGGNEDLHLPSPVDVTLDEVSNLSSNDISYEQRNLDPQLSNLPAANLKSTFAKAYDLLTDIVNKTGWEALLKYRAKVFVMEEEYRKDRSSSVVPGNKNGATEEKTSTETNGSTIHPDPSDTDASSTIAVKSPNKNVVDSDEEQQSQQQQNEFKMKRLCERWLDNLFMLLYEDLRAYTMWQAESLHFQAQQMEYKKTTLEWEILGSIAYRLKHYKEGSVAFANALSGRFSAKSQREMLKYYQMERTKILSKHATNTFSSSSASASYTHNYTKIVTQLNEKILESAIKLLVWNHRWYCDFSPSLINTLSDLVAKEGLIKVQSLVQALYSTNPGTSASASTGNLNKANELEGNHGIRDMMEDVFALLKQYDVSGSDN